MNRLLVAQGLAYQTIERRIDGIDLEELEQQFKSGKIKFFYTIPRFHYPQVIPILIRKEGYSGSSKTSMVCIYRRG